MENIKFTGFVIGAVLIAYILLTILMPLYETVTDDAVTEIQTSPNASRYALSVHGVNYFSLFIYFVPAALGIAAIIYKLKRT